MTSAARGVHSDHANGLELAVAAAPQARAALDSLIRTEDVKFSPSGRRLALVGYWSNSIAIVDVEIEVNDGRPSVSLTDATVFSSERLAESHGVDFIDDDTVVVANRGRSVEVLRTQRTAASSELSISAVEALLGFEPIPAPSAVAVHRDLGRTEMLVCSNSTSVVSRHVLNDDAGVIRVVSNERLLHRLLDMPDGAAVSPDGEWLAVSNHNGHVVMLYERAEPLNEESLPRAMLPGAQYPHGVCFSPDGCLLVVADGGAPYIHVYERPGATWHGVRSPTRSVRVMDDETFARSRHNLTDGGSKGVHVHPEGTVLAVVGESRGLVFFDLSRILEGGSCSDDESVQMSYQLTVLAAAQTRLARANARLDSLRRSRALRLTEPIRRVRQRLRSRR